MPQPTVILDILSRTPSVLAGLLEDIPSDRHHVRRFDDRWSVAECVGHLVDAQRILIERFDRFEREDDPLIADYEPPPPSDPRYQDVDLEAACARFAEIRDRTVERLRIHDAAFWVRKGRHESFEPYGTRILLGHMLNVDYAHLLQIEQVGLARLQLDAGSPA